MKSIKTLVLTFVLLTAVFTTSNAQSKIAHINTQQLLQEMPEMQQANKELQALQATYQADIESSKKEFDAKANALQTKAQGLTDAEINASPELMSEAKQLETMRNNIAEAQQNYSKELQKSTQEKLAPIYKKIQETIEKVAEAQGIDYVLDAGQGGPLLVAKGKDLLPDVKKELGL